MVLVACGSFSPPTILHTRLLEVCRDELRKRGVEVVGGYLSPVNDRYSKQGLGAASAAHRVAMCELAVQSSDWIMVDDWEARQVPSGPPCPRAYVPAG